MELSATVSDKLMHKTTEEERAQQDQLDDEEEHNFEMGLDLLMTKNAGDDNSLENEHGILKKYQNKDGHGETGGNGNESNPYLSFIQAQVNGFAASHLLILRLYLCLSSDRNSKSSITHTGR